ncbi:MAG: hypothetical protein DMG02_30480 [Acidobacteria bacterium]|nr:MAG: hypothetical protein DMG02_30480 [Acidobacteriota bacterium]
MKRAASVVLFASACLLINPHAALAQSAIAGAVKDATGAVLPGVTVEASSPALIERVRTVTTDAAGLYRIIDLRPGIYTVTFTLPGFNAIHRRLAGRGREERNAAAGAVARSARCGADGAQHLGGRLDAHRRHPQRARRRRHRRHAADLHGRSRIAAARQLDSGGRHERQRHRG